VQADLTDFVGYRQDPEIAKYQSWELSYSLEQGRALIESQTGVDWPAQDDWLQLGVRPIETQQLVGDLALHRLKTEGEYELGFTFAREHQGKGYARESAAALLDQLLTVRNAKSVVAYTDSRNLPSKKLLESLGFVNKPAESWVEGFKGETVTVEVYLLVNPKG
jgi:aminoglycoside 6'-N-acetyltransferase